MMRGEQKIGRSHLDRTAVIYLRQSMMMQVREHGESTARQYALAARAVATAHKKELLHRLKGIAIKI